MRAHATLASVNRTVRDVLRRASNLSDPEFRPVYEIAAGRLAERIQEEYRVKAEGGVDSAGIQWDETRRHLSGRNPILIDTGELINSLTFHMDGNAIVMRFNADHARYVLAVRPAWPEHELPDAWFDEFVAELQGGLRRILERALQ